MDGDPPAPERFDPQLSADMPKEGERLAVAARVADVPMLLLRGVAVWHCCPSARREPLARIHGDIDFLGRSADRSAIIRAAQVRGLRREPRLSVREHIDEFGLDPQLPASVISRADQLEFALRGASKSIVWKLQSLGGGAGRRWPPPPIEPRY
jgi:hypothetical protein